MRKIYFGLVNYLKNNSAQISFIRLKHTQLCWYLNADVDWLTGLKIFLGDWYICLRSMDHKIVLKLDRKQWTAV